MTAPQLHAVLTSPVGWDACITTTPGGSPARVWVDRAPDGAGWRATVAFTDAVFVEQACHWCYLSDVEPDRTLPSGRTASCSRPRIEHLIAGLLRRLDAEAGVGS